MGEKDETAGFNSFLVWFTVLIPLLAVASVFGGSSMSQRSAFVVGGTGATGRALVSQLVEQGWDVRVLTRKRNEDRFDMLKKENIVYTEDIENWVKNGCESMPSSTTAVFSCVGTSRQYPEVAESLMNDGDRGFAHWLTRIDVDVSYGVAKCAFDMGFRKGD